MSLETQDGSRVMKNYLTTLSTKTHDLMQRIFLLFVPKKEEKEDVKKEIEEFIKELDLDRLSIEDSEELRTGMNIFVKDTIEYINGNDNKWNLGSIITSSTEMRHKFTKFRSLMEDIIFLEADERANKEMNDFLINISKFLENNNTTPNGKK